MSKKLARIKAVLSRKALSEEEQEEKIDEIVNEEESEEDEADPADEGDDETENTAEGDEEETEAEDEEAEPEAEDDEEEKPSAKRAAAALKSARRIAASKEAKANPTFALAAIAGGVSFASFKAMAPAAGKGGALAARMADEPGAKRLGADAPRPKPTGNVTQLKPATDYYAACEGKKAG